MFLEGPTGQACELANGIDELWLKSSLIEPSFEGYILEDEAILLIL